ncbi:MAG: hypothetical protein AB1746_03190 [Candidatus Zixiibacteriota bacterium]
MKTSRTFLVLLLFVFCYQLTVAQIPGPNLWWPENEATEVPYDQLEFFWSAVPDAFMYDIYLDTCISFECMYMYLASPDSSVQFPLVGYDSLKFYWKVRALLIDGLTEWSDVWSFTSYDLRPEPQIPANGETNFEIPTIFEWTSPIDPDYFFIYVDDSPDFQNPLIFDRYYVPDTFFTWGGFGEERVPRFNTTYYYNLSLVRGSNETRRTDVWSFTTVDARPVAIFPPDDAIDVEIPVTFEWSCLIEPQYFTFMLDDEPDFNPPFVYSGQVYDTFLTVSDLDLQTTYYWKMISQPYYGETEWTEVYSFTTHCPIAEAPELIAPDDASTGLNQPIRLDWGETRDAVSYWLQIDDSPDFIEPVIEGKTSWDDRTLSGLTPGATYYWRICVEINQCGWSEWSPARSFTAGENYVCGDLNDDDHCNLLDVTYLIYYLYKGGLPPICW